MMRIPLVVMALVTPLAAAALPSAEPEPALVGGPVTMNVVTGYSPPVVVIRQGSSVTWKNTDTLAHTVTSYLGGPPDSGLMPPGLAFTATFGQPGASAYRCVLHPWMNGVVLVTPP